MPIAFQQSVCYYNHSKTITVPVEMSSRGLSACFLYEGSTPPKQIDIFRQKWSWAIRDYPYEEPHLSSPKATTNVLAISAIWLAYWVQVRQGDVPGRCPVASPQHRGTVAHSPQPQGRQHYLHQHLTHPDPKRVCQVGSLAIVYCLMHHDWPLNAHSGMVVLIHNWWARPSQSCSHRCTSHIPWAGSSRCRCHWWSYPECPLVWI